MKVFVKSILLSFVLSFSSLLFAIDSEPVDEIQKLVGIDDEEHMGYSVAIDGDTMVVSAWVNWNNKTAKVYIYERADVNGAFVEIDKIYTPDDCIAYFGHSVDISGDTIVVGAVGHYHADVAGSAYVYVKTSNGWEKTAKLTSSDGVDRDSFGHSVAVSGDTVVVGAKDSDIPERDSGSAYVFTKPISSSWADANETARLGAFDGDIVDSFGSSVAIDGEKILIGAKGANHNTDDPTYDADKDGAAYLFRKPYNGWVDTNTSVKIEPDIIREQGWFGSSVAIDGTTIAVGSPGNWSQGGTDLLKGALYIFEENPASGSYEQKAILTASDGEYNDDFADFEGSIDIDDNIIVVGARSKMDSDGQLTLSASYLFKKPSTGWRTSVENTKFTSSDIVLTDSFGGSVGISGDTIVIGAYSKNKLNNGTISDGATYIFNVDNSSSNSTSTTSANPAVIMYLLN